MKEVQTNLLNEALYFLTQKYTDVYKTWTPGPWTTLRLWTRSMDHLFGPSPWTPSWTTTLFKAAPYSFNSTYT